MSLFKGIVEISSIEDKYELLADDDIKVVEKMINYLMDRK